MTVLNVGSRPAGIYFAIHIHFQQIATAEQGDKRGCLELIQRILDEAADLARRLSAMSFDMAGCRIAKVSTVELANSIVTKPGAFADCAGPRLVMNHSKRQLELAAFTRVAIVS